LFEQLTVAVSVNFTVTALIV